MVLMVQPLLIEPSSELKESKVAASVSPWRHKIPDRQLRDYACHPSGCDPPPFDVRHALAFYLQRTKPIMKSSSRLFVAIAEDFKGGFGMHLRMLQNATK